ncbi:MAG: cell division protein ZipA C-terminal FtsZ-binding domain-containing protein, partial [Zoogloeaceae bacterium]|nr:cell division protein ZipA C-terminal FtsZ-binding domain-containing protein [Zoogloeaceae bacterium]
MNETEIGILLLGGLIVLGVVAYNKWQERQHRRNMEEGFFQYSEDAEDVLLARREAEFSISSAEPDYAPSWGADEAERPVSQENAAWNEAAEDSAETEAMLDAYSESPAAALPEDDPLSPMIDLIAELKGESPIDLAALRREYARVFAPFGRRLNWSGLNETDGEWDFLPGTAPEGGGSYRRLRAGLQLVNREGVVPAKAISHFLESFPSLAEKLGVVCQLPEAGAPEWLEQAEQLDVFCAGLDIVLCLSMVPASGRIFAGTQIRALAEAESMTLEDGTYTLRNEEGVQLFRFWNTDETHPFSVEEMKFLKSSDLTFQFDVPCVPRGQQVYMHMLTVIRRFAKVLDGVL